MTNREEIERMLVSEARFRRCCEYFIAFLIGAPCCCFCSPGFAEGIMDIGKPQNSVYGPHQFLDHAFVTKAGETVLLAEMEGIDGECRTDEEMEAQHGRLLAAFVSLPDEIRIMTYLVKTEGAELPETESATRLFRSRQRGARRSWKTRAGQSPW
jgi:hypothetical protein